MEIPFLEDGVFKARVLSDSIGASNVRLTTFECTYPRFVHAEVLTHRDFSRNSASSRAIPVRKNIERVRQNPVIPIFWGKNQKGMQADEALTPWEQELAKRIWLMGRDVAAHCAELLEVLGLHKQLANRILEPWLTITTIITATEWGNFFNLRCAKPPQPEMSKLADMMATLYYEGSQPRSVGYGEWHLPLIQDDERSLDIETLKRVSVGRCARVSYLTHGGRRDIDADVDLHDRLMQDGHMSPFEHIATPLREPFPYMAYSANFRGWQQYRKIIPGENRSTFDYEAYKQRKV